MKCYSLEPLLRRFFYWYGGFVHRYRWVFFFVPLFITPLLGTGFLWFRDYRVDDPAYVFTPRESRWKTELTTFSRLWPLSENKFVPGKSFESKRFVNVLCKAKDGGNVLRPAILEEIELLNNFIMYNVSVPTIDGKYNLTYQDLCLSYDWVCGANEHIRMFQQMTQVGRVIDLTYPKGGNKDTPAYLGTVLGDITLNKSDNTVMEARITQLFYFLKQQPDAVMRYSMDFEYAVERFILRAFESPLISLSFAHYHSLQDGLDENAQRFVPNFIISLCSLTVFCIVCAFTYSRHSRPGIDWITSKPYVACCGLFNTLIALISSFGTMLLLGIPYNVINSIIPFLIIAIGIDDMFIMNGCWEQTDASLPPRLRMSQMMAGAGVAISITNITDILAFLIGCSTELPGIELFCLYAFASCLFCYVYQLTYFAGFMAIMGVAEQERRHCLFLYKMPIPKAVEAKSMMKLAITSNGVGKIVYPATDVVSNGLNHGSSNGDSTNGTLDTSLNDSTYSKHSHHNDSSTSNGVASRVSSNGSTPSSGTTTLNGQSKKAAPLPPYASPSPLATTKTNPLSGCNQPKHGVAHRSPHLTHRFFGDYFGPTLIRDGVRALIIFVYICYLLVGVLGSMHFREGLEPSHLVTASHYIASYFKDVKLFWKMGPQLHVALLEPPNLTDPIQRQQLMALVRAFEDTEYTMGREGTVFFFLEYLNYLDQLNAELENTDRIWNQKLKSWLKFTGASTQWDTDIVFNNKTKKFEAFRFQVAMKNIVEPNQHKLAAKLLREVADAQPFHVEIFHEAFPFADQYLIILSSTCRNVVISLMVMTCIAFLMIPSIPSAALIVLSIISICIGVFGYMTLWGVNLDAVSMISIIMSIGFAVDLSAHIVYAFITAEGDTKQRVVNALEHLGWPIFQGAMSTIVGISVLYTVDAYMILTMFKTIWLTMVLGLLHGLVFMPVLLSFIPLWFFQVQSLANIF